MRFWSKGLGERELEIELDKSNISKEEGKVVLRGILKAPVKWNYEVTLFDDDIGGLLRVMLSIPGITYFFKNITGVGTYITQRGKMGSQPEEEKPGDAKAAGAKPASVKTAETQPADAKAEKSTGS